MKYLINILLVLFIIEYSVAQEFKHASMLHYDPSYENPILDPEIINHNPHNNLYEDNKILLQDQEEMNPNYPKETDRLFEIQDTIYLLDSVIYYHYPSENDSVSYLKVVYHYLPDKRYDFIEEFLYDDFNFTWINSYRIEYTYNEDLKYSSVNYFRWSEEDQEWIHYSRSNYEYNESGYRTLINHEQWNDLENKLILDYKLFNDYDDNGNWILDGYIIWDSEYDMWMSGNKNEYEYNADNKRTMSSLYEYDPYSDPKWVGKYKYTIEYDGDKQISISNFSWIYWSEEHWFLSQKDEFQYDELNRQKITITSLFDEYGQNYLMEKTENVYNDADQIILKNKYEWLSESWILQQQDTTIFIYQVGINYEFVLKRTSEGMPWDSVSKKVQNIDIISSTNEILGYSYTGYNWLLVNKTITIVIENYSYYEGYTWDDYFQQLIGTMRYERLYYDEGTRRSGYTRYKWSTDLNNWIGDYKYLYDYFVYNVSKSYTRYSWDINENIWKVNYKYYNYYSMLINTSYDPMNSISGEISFYPNPANDFINISMVGKPQGINTYHIYDLTGKLVESGQMNQQSTVISVSKLQDGMYILRVGDNPDYARKIIIRK